MIDNGALAFITSETGAAVLSLNNAFATELSLLDLDRLSMLLREASYARHIGLVDAFLIAFDEKADYDSPNYLWFRARYPRFVYVDRVAVALATRGLGHARSLYVDLITHATEARQDVIICEVNFDPPNPASDGCHAALGFGEVGLATIHDGSKTGALLGTPYRADARLRGLGEANNTTHTMSH